MAYDARFRWPPSFFYGENGMIKELKFEAAQCECGDLMCKNGPYGAAVASGIEAVDGFVIGTELSKMLGLGKIRGTAGYFGTLKISNTPKRGWKKLVFKVVDGDADLQVSKNYTERFCVDGLKAIGIIAKDGGKLWVKGSSGKEKT